jgi:hypothetical protein
VLVLQDDKIHPEGAKLDQIANLQALPL